MFGFDPIEIADPVGFQEIDQQDNAAAGPCNGIGTGDRGQFINELYGDCNIADPENAPAGKHGEHGNSCLSRTSQNSRDAVAESKQTVEKTNGTGIVECKLK